MLLALGRISTQRSDNATHSLQLFSGGPEHKREYLHTNTKSAWTQKLALSFYRLLCDALSHSRKSVWLLSKSEAIIIVFLSKVFFKLAFTASFTRLVMNKSSLQLLGK
jgi:hypothetical protein